VSIVTNADICRVWFFCSTSASIVSHHCSPYKPSHSGGSISKRRGSAEKLGEPLRQKLRHPAEEHCRRQKSTMLSPGHDDPPLRGTHAAGQGWVSIRAGRLQLTWLMTHPDIDWRWKAWWFFSLLSTLLPASRPWIAPAACPCSNEPTHAHFRSGKEFKMEAGILLHLAVLLRYAGMPVSGLWFWQIAGGKAPSCTSQGSNSAASSVRRGEYYRPGTAFSGVTALSLADSRPVN
jgi:hypothetical protein